MSLGLIVSVAKPLPRVVEAVVKGPAPEVLVAKLSHSYYVKRPDFENSAHLVRGRRARASLKQVKP